MSVQHYRELIVWQRAMDLVEMVYRTTEAFPKTEIYCLTSQLRRSAISIPSNIAEGQGRETTRDFLHFLSIAQGSIVELETQVLIAARLRYIQREQEEALLGATGEIGRMLRGLRKALRDKLAPGH